MAVNQDTYDNPAWARPASGAGWGQAGQVGQAGQGPFSGGFREFMDGLPRPVAIAMTVVAFVFWWPVGLAVLAYMVGSGRLGARWRRNRMPGWMNTAWQGGGGRSGASGNHAFDEYRMQTLKRLEEEQQEFGSFLERLRFAKDKAEFDQFMAERRGRPPAPSADGEQNAA